MDLPALAISLKLALLTTIVLLPLALLVARLIAWRRFVAKNLVEALIALPLVLPPTVLGYYLLTAFSKNFAIGAAYHSAFSRTLAFSFEGLLLASIVFNIPFAVQPMQRAFEALPDDIREAAWCSGMSRWRTFYRITASKAIELDNELAWGHVALGGAHLANGDPDAAIKAVGHALVVQPNSYEANLFMGLYSQFAGQSRQAVERLKFAQRLNPVDTVRKLAFLGMAYFMNGNYSESAAIWEKRLDKFPIGNEIGYVFLAATYAMLGRMEDATSIKEALSQMNPEFSLAEW